MNDIISDPEKLTAERLTDILKKAGVLQSAKVERTNCRTIGDGLFGNSLRFEIEYDRREENAPSSIVGKFPSLDPTARASGSEIGIYMTEIRFYQEIAKKVAIRSPRCFYAEIDPANCDFGLLMEDMTPARTADQLTGCSLDEAREAVKEAAALHSAQWNDPSLYDVEWMKIRKVMFSSLAARFEDYFQQFHARYANMFEPEYMELSARFTAKAGRFLTRQPTTWTLIHGDFRLDNMLFDAGVNKAPMVTMDWQSIAPDDPTTDVAFFIQTSVPMEQRKIWEPELVQLYHSELCRRGIKDYSLDALWKDYRITSFLGLFTAIFASIAAKRTERGDAMFMRMARGAAAQMLDLDTLGAIG